MNFLQVWSTKGLVKNLKALWLTVAVRCRDSSITPVQLVSVSVAQHGFSSTVYHLHLQLCNMQCRTNAVVTERGRGLCVKLQHKCHMWTQLSQLQHELPKNNQVSSVRL